MNLKNKKYFILFILSLLFIQIILYCPIHFLKNLIIHPLIAEASEKNKEAKTAYQEFLDGKRKVLIDSEALNKINNLDYITFPMNHLESNEIFLQDMLHMAVSTYQEKLNFAEYAYIDCGMDGKEELAIRFTHIYDRNTFIIVYENGQLYLRYIFDLWPRSHEYLYYNGYITGQGSSGACYTNLSADFLDQEGKLYFSVTNSISLNENQKYSEEINKTFEKEEIYIIEKEFIVQDKKYLCLEIEHEETKSVDIKKCEKFCQLVEQNYEKLYSEDEIFEYIKQERKNLKIKRECMELKIPEWKIMDNRIYSPYLKIMDNKSNLYESSENLYPDKDFFSDKYTDFTEQMSK